MNRDAFLRAVNGMEWGDIERLTDLALDTEGVVTEGDRDEALRRAIKSEVRRTIKDATDEHGEPLFHSIEQVDADGSVNRVYKQEAFFDAGDYQQVIDYHAGRAAYHAGRAVRMKDRGEAQGHNLRVPAVFEQLVLEEA